MKEKVKELVNKKYDVNNVIPTYFKDTETDYIRNIYEELLSSIYA